MDPVYSTNFILLQILHGNTSYDGDGLDPDISTSVITAISILFTSLFVTLLVAFIAVLGKQWIHYYTRVSTWGNIVDRGRERQAKLLGLQKWGLQLILETLPVMLQFALLLFGIALPVYLWDLDVSASQVVIAITSAGLAFYSCITMAAMTWRDCPFQTPLSILFLEIPSLAKEFTTLALLWLKHRSRRKATILLRQIKQTTKDNYLVNSLKRASKIPVSETTFQAPPDEDIPNVDYPITLSNPAFWRQDPLFDSPIRKDIGASAGFWLLENSTDFSAATAVAAVFSEFQWPSHHRSSTALIRLHDTYIGCFRGSESKKYTRIKALQSAAAYYVLYHTQLIWSTWRNLEVETRKLPASLPPDLFLYQHNEEWGGDDVFEYLLHLDAESRLEPVESPRFLSYIAPYWFCGDSDAAIRFQPGRLQTLNELIRVLEQSCTLDPATLTNCVLCVGVVMDLPLHPEDLVRVNKRCAPLFSYVGGGFDWRQRLFCAHLQGSRRTCL